MTITIGVLALQGAFLEHLNLLKRAAGQLKTQGFEDTFEFTEVRNVQQLERCDALIIPGGESTTMSLVAAQSGLLEPLREFVKYANPGPFHGIWNEKTDLFAFRVDRKPTWGTCAGLILLSEGANATKKGGQDLIGGLDVRVNRNHFGRQVESFQAGLDLPFLNPKDYPSNEPFPGIFIRAPVVEKILPNLDGIQEGERAKAETVVAPSKPAKNDQAQRAMSSHVDIMGVLPGRLKKAAGMGAEVNADDEAGDIIAVKQGNVFGTSFHPELTPDIRIHVWWLKQVSEAVATKTATR